MDYQKVYNALISFRKSNPLKKSKKLYTELHHIIPRCLGGSDESRNLIRLTAREHFVAHRLLTKINPSSKGLQYAVFTMAHTRKGIKVVSSRESSKLSAVASERMTTTSKKLWEDEEFREKMSAAIKKLWEDPKHRERVILAAKDNAMRQWKDEVHREFVSTTNSTIITKMWKDGRYVHKTKEGRKRF